MKYLQRYLCCAILIMTQLTIVVQAQNAKAMENTYIFTSDNLNQYTADVKAIYQVMGKYYEGVEKAKLEYLKEVFHPDWFMKDTDNKGEIKLNLEDKATFIERVRKHGPYKGYAQYRDMDNISFAHKHLALVRINKVPSQNTTSFFLIRTANGWKILDKLWVIGRKAHTKPEAQKPTNQNIEQMVKRFFEAKAGNDQKTLNDLLHKDWESKTINASQELRSMSRAEFLNGLSKSSYEDGNRFINIEAYHDKLAIVRIDQPEKNQITFLVVFKVAQQWKIVSQRVASKAK